MVVNAEEKRPILDWIVNCGPCPQLEPLHSTCVAHISQVASSATLPPCTRSGVRLLSLVSSFSAHGPRGRIDPAGVPDRGGGSGSCSPVAAMSRSRRCSERDTEAEADLNLNLLLNLTRGRVRRKNLLRSALMSYLAERLRFRCFEPSLLCSDSRSGSMDHGVFIQGASKKTTTTEEH